jgi:hypothetical protein
MTKVWRYVYIMHINTAGPKYANQDNVNRNVCTMRQLPVEKKIKWGHRRKKICRCYPTSDILRIRQWIYYGTIDLIFRYQTGHNFEILVFSDIRRTPYTVGAIQYLILLSFTSNVSMTVNTDMGAQTRITTGKWTWTLKDSEVYVDVKYRQRLSPISVIPGIKLR